MELKNLNPYFSAVKLQPIPQSLIFFLMKKYFVEAIGSFFLTLVWITAGQRNDAAGWGALALGMTLAALIYFAKDFSGGHFNPVISIAMLMRGAINRIVLPYYILAQLAGALVAAMAAYFILVCQGEVDFRLMNGLDPLCALPAEFLGAFGLCLVYMKAQSSPNTDPALPAASVLMALSFVFAPISGAIFNPAIALGACVAGASPWSGIWLYLIGPMIGAAAAASTWMWLESE